MAELVSKARRIRYSRHFFPEKIADLRARLFAEIEQGSMEQEESKPSCEGCQVNDGLPGGSGPADEESHVNQGETEQQLVKRLSWTLVEQEEFTQNMKEYRRRRRKALLDALGDWRDGRHVSRRVINIWAYQRKELRWAS
jgi:hypothetical protein